MTRVLRICLAALLLFSITGIAGLLTSMNRTLVVG